MLSFSHAIKSKVVNIADELPNVNAILVAPVPNLAIDVHVLVNERTQLVKERLTGLFAPLAMGL
jgi:hypothetical protein